MMNRCGFSVYLSDPHCYEEAFVQSYAKLGYTLAFTSLHIPEETITLAQLKELLKLYQKYNICVCADVSPHTLKKLQIHNLKELYEIGIDYLRFDYGIPYEELSTLHEGCKIMINASTIREHELEELKKQGIASNRILGLHNFYPKVHTGLSMAFVKAQNEILHRFDIETLAFVPGFTKARGPFFEFLPTVEIHRRQPAVLSAMQLLHEGNCDGVMIGDPMADEMTIQYLPRIVQKTFVLPVKWEHERYAKLMGYTMLHNRFDESAETIRISESRFEEKFKLGEEPIPYEGFLEEGVIVLSNTVFARYCNEVEIVKHTLPHEKRVNIMGRISDVYHLILMSIKGEDTLFFIDEKL